MSMSQSSLYALAAGTALLLSGCIRVTGEGPILSPLHNVSHSYTQVSSYFHDRFSSVELGIQSLSSAASPVGTSVDQLLAKLRSETDHALRQEDRNRETLRRQELRHQLEPKNPTQTVQDQKEKNDDRATAIEDRLAAQQATMKK